MSARRKGVFALLTITVIVGFYPVNTLDVPHWKLRVVNESEIAYPAKEVTQAWKNYTLNRTPGQNFETRLTDASGYVEFPERKTQASLWARAYLNLYARAMSLAHGGVGVHAYVHASGPQGYAEVRYTRGESPPAKLILPSR